MPKLTKEEFSRRFKIALAEAGMTQTALAAALGIKQAQVNYWAMGHRLPKLENMEKIAEILDKPMEYFYANNKETTSEYLHRVSRKVDLIPILGISSATNEKFILEEGSSTFLHFPKTGEHQFAIKVEGICMENPNDPRNSIYDGDYIIIDQDVTPTNGDVVLARISAEYSTIKRMYIKESTVELIPDNPKCKKLIKKQSEVEIIGKVVNVFRTVEKKRKHA